MEMNGEKELRDNLTELLKIDIERLDSLREKD
jgi:hypothetical protein